MTGGLLIIISVLAVAVAVLAVGGTRLVRRCDYLTGQLRAERLKRQEEYEEYARLFDENRRLRAGQN